jgi:nucleoside-diphosphate-sugar epimerase
MKTLVTGATGFIGRRLMQPDYRALVRNPAGFRHEVVGDLLDRRSLQNACSDIELIFHCAGHAHAFSADSAGINYDVNFVGVKNLLEAAGQAGVKRFVFLSSVKAMADPGDNCVNEDWPGEPLKPYGRAKRAAEEAVIDAGIQFGMHVVNLRLAMVYGHGGRGNLERMARAIRSGWFPALPETGNKRSLVHVQDVVDVMHLVAENADANGKTYIVAESQAYSGREIYQALRIALGMSGEPTFTLPAGLLRTAAQLNGRLAEVVDRLIGSACYSPARLERELGWQSRIALAEGLSEMLAFSGAKL